MRFLLVCAAAIVVLAVGGWVQAQAPIPVPNSTPTVITGNDLGFQVDSTTGGIPTGKLVVKVNGKWIEPKYTIGVRPLTGR
jgi:hypothetical protein